MVEVYVGDEPTGAFIYYLGGVQVTLNEAKEYVYGVWKTQQGLA